MRNGRKMILMYSQLKIYCNNIKRNDYAEVDAIEVIPVIIGTLTK
jgi:hypothetical protein